MVIDRNDQVRALLWLGIEDYGGLWEAIWQLKSLDPTKPEPEIRIAAERILRQLAARGDVMLFRARGEDQKLTPIPSGEVAAVLARDGNWIAPTLDATSVRFGTTPFGEATHEDITSRRRRKSSE